MTSPLLYPLLTVLSTLDGILPVIPSEAAVLADSMSGRSDFTATTAVELRI